MKSLALANTRLLPLALSGVLALGMLAACSGPAETGDGPTTSAPTTDQTAAPSGEGEDLDGSSITIGTFSPLAPQYEVWAAAYMEEFPDRTVEILPVSEDFTQYQQILATQRISNTMPDLIFNVDFLANSFAQDDLVLDLAPMMEAADSELPADGFLPQFLGQYRPLDDPEKITGIPVSADSTALMWNKTIFDKYGVTEYPSDDWTYDDFRRVAAEIQTKSNGAVYGATPPAEDGGSISYWGPILMSYGAKVYDPETNTVDIDSPEAIEAWKAMLAFYPDATGPYSTSGGDAWDFASGQFAMGVSSSALVGAVRAGLEGQEWDLARMPSINGKHPSGGGSYGFSISATSENVDAAWAFLSWFYNPEAGSLVAQSADGGSTIPPTLSGLEGGAWSEAEVPAGIETLAVTAKDAQLMVAMPGSTQNVMTDATKTAFQEVLLTGAAPEEAFAKAAEITNAALADEAAN